MCTKYGIRNLNGKLCNTFFHCMSALMYMYIRPCIILHLFLLLMHYMIMFLYTLMILERMTDCHGLFLFRQFVVLTTRFSGLFLFRQDHFVITMLDISSAIHSKKVIFCCYLEKWGGRFCSGCAGVLWSSSTYRLQILYLQIYLWCIGMSLEMRPTKLNLIWLNQTLKAQTLFIDHWIEELYYYDYDKRT